DCPGRERFQGLAADVAVDGLFLPGGSEAGVVGGAGNCQGGGPGAREVEVQPCSDLYFEEFANRPRQAHFACGWTPGPGFGEEAGQGHGIEILYSKEAQVLPLSSRIQSPAG